MVCLLRRIKSFRAKHRFLSYPVWVLLYAFVGNRLEYLKFSWSPRRRQPCLNKLQYMILRRCLSILFGVRPDLNGF